MEDQRWDLSGGAHHLDTNWGDSSLLGPNLGLGPINIIVIKEYLW